MSLQGSRGDLNLRREKQNLSASAGGGASPSTPRGTLIYVPGCGNHPRAADLKQQWDRAIFGHDLGEKSRTVYWRDSELHPKPLPDGMLTDPSAFKPGSLEEPVSECVELLCESKDSKIARLLLDVGKEIAANSGDDPATLAWLSASFLPSLYYYLEWSEWREYVQDAFLARTAAGSGPCVVIAHDLGALVAYDALSILSREKASQRKFTLITLGAPLGSPALVKHLIGDQGKLSIGQSRWQDIVDLSDPVAAHSDLVGNRIIMGGDDAPPMAAHSPETYLRSAPLRGLLGEVLGPDFGQSLDSFCIAKDVVSIAEDADDQERIEVLIEYCETGNTRSQEERVEALKASLRAVLRERLSEADVECHRSFVSAKLTRREIEELADNHYRSSVNAIWQDSTKTSLVWQSIKTVQAMPAQLGYGATGTGITWAVLDSGIDGGHPHFEHNKNILGQWDCTLYQQEVEGEAHGCLSVPPTDRIGHGTHVAAIIAGAFRGELIVSGHGPAVFSGVAPEAKLWSYRVLGDNGKTKDRYILRALDHIAATNEQGKALKIHGVNLSLGGPVDPSVFGCGHSPVCRELRRLIGQGVVVVVAAGNDGLLTLESSGKRLKLNSDLSIADPANLEESIAVGAIHKSSPHTYGVSYFSSRGPTVDGRLKPDLVAPGERILSAKANARSNSGRAEDLYAERSGTSMAAPHVSGVIAAFLSQRREFIGYPERVKKILLEHCTDLARDRYFQGHGMPNLVKMLVET